MTAARVGVPVPVLYAGIAAIIGLLVAVGFFAGRASSGSGGAAAGSETLPAPSPAPLAEWRPDPPADATAPVAAAPPVDGVIVPAPLPVSPATAGDAPPPAVNREVAEYFRRMDAAQAAAKTWSDPTALAQEVLAQAMRGDSGGFDRLIAASAGARAAVKDIDVPPPCAEHHRLTLALLEEAVMVLTRLRDGVAAGDASAVAGIASSGSAMEARARAVDVLGASLRSQYGVTPAP